MAKQKGLKIDIKSEDVMYTNISTSKDGYNSARVVIKTGDSEYMSVSCEWEGEKIPGFAMDLMGFMKNSGTEKSGVWEGQEEAYAEFAAKKEEICDYGVQLVFLSVHIFSFNILLLIYPKSGFLVLQCHKYLLNADNT